MLTVEQIRTEIRTLDLHKKLQALALQTVPEDLVRLQEWATWSLARSDFAWFWLKLVIEGEARDGRPAPPVTVVNVKMYLGQDPRHPFDLNRTTFVQPWVEWCPSGPSSFLHSVRYPFGLSCPSLYECVVCIREQWTSMHAHGMLGKESQKGA